MNPNDPDNNNVQVPQRMVRTGRAILLERDFYIHEETERIRAGRPKPILRADPAWLRAIEEEERRNAEIDDD